MWHCVVCVRPHGDCVAPAGVSLLKDYQKEVEQLEAERQELGNAERLFDLSITMYPELVQILKEMKGLEQIYALYEEQKVCAERWRTQGRS